MITLLNMNRPRLYDATVWAFTSTCLLLVLDIGFLSGDAVKHASAFAQDRWQINPNHLLMEPIAWVWFEVTHVMGWKAAGPDRLKILSIVAGAITIGLFRFLIPSLIGVNRNRANIATLSLCGSYAFLALWISGEPIMLQMPILVLALYSAVRYMSKPDPTKAFWTGALFAAAALLFISNAVIGLTVLLSLLTWRVLNYKRTEGVKEFAASATGALTVGVLGLWIGWLIEQPPVGLLEWVGRYAGSTSLSESPVYGIIGATPNAVLEAAVRSAYGAGIAVVDASSTVGLLEGTAVSTLIALVSGLMLISAAVIIIAALKRVLLASAQHGWWAILVGWIAGVLAFGFYFNNSDDQFFVQLTIPIAFLALVTPIKPYARKWWVTTLACVVLWNIVYVWDTMIMYPRGERLNELSIGVDGAQLVVYPGFDEPGRLLFLLPDSLYAARMSIMEIANTRTPEIGLQIITDSIQRVIKRGGDVRIINVLEANRNEQPWKVLAMRGYDHARVVDRLKATGHPLVRLPVGHFDVWRAEPESQ